MSLVDDVTARIRNEVQPNAKVPHHVLQRVAALTLDHNLRYTDVNVAFKDARKYDGELLVVTDTLLVLARFADASVMSAHAFGDGCSSDVQVQPLTDLRAVRMDAGDPNRNRDEYWNADWDGAWPPGGQVTLVLSDFEVALPYSPAATEEHARRVQELVALALAVLGGAATS